MSFDRAQIASYEGCREIRERNIRIVVLKIRFLTVISGFGHLKEKRQERFPLLPFASHKIDDHRVR
jgi:hypothetical protein